MSEFFIDHFLPSGVHSGWGIVVSLLVRPYVRPYVSTYVRPKNFWFQMIFLVFWDHHISSSWRFLKFLSKVVFWADHALFWPFFPIYKGLLGARCKSGELCWHGIVCRFWIYIVVCPDVFFIFSKKVFVSPTD